MWKITATCEDLDCSLVTGTDGTNSGVETGVCTCNTAEKPSWNISAVWCQINCSAIPFSTSQNTQTSCRCLSRYVWLTENSTCWLNCSAVLYSTGASADNAVCPCPFGYTWYPNYRACKYNCSYDIYANVTASDNTTAILSSCYCIPKFLYNSSTKRCEIDCSN
jgi:hypothetical protein